MPQAHDSLHCNALLYMLPILGATVSETDRQAGPQHGAHRAGDTQVDSPEPANPSAE